MSDALHKNLRSDKSRRGTRVSWTTTVDPVWHMGNLTHRESDYLTWPYPKFLRFQIACLRQTAPISLGTFVPPIWICLGFLSHRWLLSGLIALLMVFGIVLVMALTQSHLHRRQALRGRLVRKVRITTRGVRIDGSVYFFHQMRGIDIQRDDHGKLALVIGWGDSTVWIDIPDGVDLDEVRHSLPHPAA